MTRCRLLWAGSLIQMNGGRLPKRIILGNLEVALRRGLGGKENEWTDCAQSNIRLFVIEGDWEATALEAEMWAETVTESGRMFMAAWGQEEVDAVRLHEEKREATETGKVAIAHGKCRILRSDINSSS